MNKININLLKSCDHYNAFFVDGCIAKGIFASKIVKLIGEKNKASLIF